MNLSCTEPLPTAASIDRLAPGLWSWSAYSPHHKVELRSHAWIEQGLISLFDPIPLAPGLLPSFLGEGQGCQIFLTNANHPRDTVGWLRSAENHFHTIPKVHCPDLSPALIDTRVKRGSWTCISLPGGAQFETAYLHPRQGILVVGDALVNLPPRGLEILPAKYCVDQVQLQHSLQQLLDLDLQRVLFAHGNQLTGAELNQLYSLIKSLPSTQQRRP